MDVPILTPVESKSHSKQLNSAAREMALASTLMTASLFVEKNTDPIVAPPPFSIDDNHSHIAKNAQLDSIQKDAEQQAQRDERIRQVQIAEADFIIQGLQANFPLFDWNVQAIDCTITSKDSLTEVHLLKRTHDNGRTFGNTDIVVNEKDGNPIRRLVHDNNWKNTSIYEKAPSTRDLWPVSGDTKEEGLKIMADILPSILKNAIQEERVVSHIRDRDPVEN